jgi:hypothetical protein
MKLIENQQLVETFVADRSDPPLRESIRVGSMHWGADDMNMLGGKDRIESLGDLRIVVVDQEVHARGAFFEVPDYLAGLLVNPGRGWMFRTTSEVDATAA